MKRKFLLSIALALIYSTAGAQSLRKPDVEEELLRKERTSIMAAIKQNVMEESMAIRLTNRVPWSKVAPLTFFLRDRDMRKCCYNYIYADSLVKRVRCKLEIDSIYRDSINTILIPIRGSKVSGENISYALFCRKSLKLDSVQYDYIMDKALDMARRIYKNRTLNVWNEEMDLLRKTLSKKQLDAFFINKHSPAVTMEADNVWKRLMEAGLTEGIDSVKEMNLAVNYYFERRKIKDLYRYYGTSQKKYLAELSRQMPVIVKMVDALDKNARISESERRNGTIGKGFVW
ncbi:MAG: hypothetical protein J6B33_06780 [Prevotella sp.]|nr:hypothetical protein [Prevotella sp.]